MKLNLLTLLLLTIITSTLMSPCLAKTRRDVKYRSVGVFYSLDGGTKGGEICFHTGRKVLCIYYDAPIKASGLRKGEEFHFGAIYRIQYRQSGKTYLLDRIHFTGRFDSAVKSADELVYNYYELLSQGDYPAAHALFSPSSIARYPLEQFKSEVSGKTYKVSPRWIPPNPLAAYGIPTFGTKIIRCSASKATVFVSLFLFTGEYKFARFDLLHLRDGWRISRIRTISESRFIQAYS